MVKLPLISVIAQCWFSKYSKEKGLRKWRRDTVHVSFKKLSYLPTVYINELLNVNKTEELYICGKYMNKLHHYENSEILWVLLFSGLFTQRIISSVVKFPLFNIYGSEITLRSVSYSLPLFRKRSHSKEIRWFNIDLKWNFAFLLVFFIWRRAEELHKETVCK